MEIKRYKNIKEAFENLIKRDKPFTLLKHSLTPKNKIKLHYHEKAHEWVVADNGRFIAVVGREEKLLKLKDMVVSIKFPKGKRHTIKILSPMTYFVIRDREDTSIYLE